MLEACARGRSKMFYLCSYGCVLIAPAGKLVRLIRTVTFVDHLLRKGVEQLIDRANGGSLLPGLVGGVHEQE